MSQHGEDPAVVRGFSVRVLNTLRSAATVALTASLALTVATASALPLRPAHRAGSSRITTAPESARRAPLTQRHSRPLPPPTAGPLAGVSATRTDSPNALRDALTGAIAAAPLVALLALGAVVSAPTTRLLHHRSKASRTRGQPDVG